VLLYNKMGNYIDIDLSKISYLKILYFFLELLFEFCFGKHVCRMGNLSRSWRSTNEMPRNMSMSSECPDNRKREMAICGGGGSEGEAARDLVWSSPHPQGPCPSPRSDSNSNSNSRSQVPKPIQWNLATGHRERSMLDAVCWTWDAVTLMDGKWGDSRGGPEGAGQRLKLDPSLSLTVAPVFGIPYFDDKGKAIYSCPRTY